MPDRRGTGVVVSGRNEAKRTALQLEPRESGTDAQFVKAQGGEQAISIRGNRIVVEGGYPALTYPNQEWALSRTGPVSVEPEALHFISTHHVKRHFLRCSPTLKRNHHG